MKKNVRKFDHIPTDEIKADLKWSTTAIVDLSLQISHFKNYSAIKEVREMVHTRRRLEALQHKLRGIISHRKTTENG